MGKLCYLIGVPTCGKTTLGRQVAELLNLPFYDTDEMARAKIDRAFRLERRTLLTYKRLFEEGQRIAVLSFIYHNGPAIIATGAEVALNPEYIEVMKDTGYLIYIKRNIESILGELTRYVDRKAVLVYARELPNYEAVADFTLDNNAGEHNGVTLLRTYIEAIVKKVDNRAVT